VPHLRRLCTFCFAEKTKERFIARKGREAMGRRSSLRDPAHKNVRRKKPGRYVRNDRGLGRLYVGAKAPTA